MRRLLAFLSWISGALSSFYAIPYGKDGWYVFIPALSFLALSVILPILTTISDLKTIAETIKGSK